MHRHHTINIKYCTAELIWVRNTSSYSAATVLIQQGLDILDGEGVQCYKMLSTYTASSSFCSDRFIIIHSIYLNEMWTFKFAWSIRVSSEQDI